MRTTLTPLPADHGLGPEYRSIQDDAQPETNKRIAAIIRQFDGTNDAALAQKIVNMVHEGEPLED